MPKGKRGKGRRGASQLGDGRGGRRRAPEISQGRDRAGHRAERIASDAQFKKLEQQVRAKEIAVSDQLCGSTKMHSEIRALVILFMTLNYEDFKPFVGDEDWDHYLFRMSRDGAWGTHLELQAVSRSLQVNLVIHQLNQPLWTIKTFGDQSPTLHLAYYVGEHYSSVRFINEPLNAEFSLPKDSPYFGLRRIEMKRRLEVKKVPKEEKDPVDVKTEDLPLESTSGGEPQPAKQEVSVKKEGNVLFISVAGAEASPPPPPPDDWYDDDPGIALAIPVDDVDDFDYRGGVRGLSDDEKFAVAALSSSFGCASIRRSDSLVRESEAEKSMNRHAATGGDQSRRPVQDRFTYVAFAGSSCLKFVYSEPHLSNKERKKAKRMEKLEREMRGEGAPAKQADDSNSLEIIQI